MSLGRYQLFMVAPVKAISRIRARTPPYALPRIRDVAVTVLRRALALEPTITVCQMARFMRRARLPSRRAAEINI